MKVSLYYEKGAPCVDVSHITMTEEDILAVIRRLRIALRWLRRERKLKELMIIRTAEEEE